MISSLFLLVMVKSLRGPSAEEKTFPFSTCASEVQLMAISADAKARANEFLSSKTTIAPGLVGSRRP